VRGCLRMWVCNRSQSISPACGSCQELTFCCWLRQR
jgi:hypothetical protein